MDEKSKKNIFLSVNEVSKDKILKKISFNVYNGEFVSVIGPRGCGKSTLLKVIAGIIKPDSGNIDYFCLNTGMMSYKQHYLEWYTSCITDMCGPKVSCQSTSTKRTSPSIFVGKPIQKMQLLISMADSVDLLLIDDAFVFLDYDSRKDMCSFMKKSAKEKDTAVIMVTNDIKEAEFFSDEIISIQ